MGRSKGKILSSQRKYLVSQAKQVNIMNTHYLVAYFVLRQFFTHRLSIARAVYQNSSILIMDEATSALDIRSELLLKEALRNLVTNHTVTVSCFCLCFVVWPFQDTSHHAFHYKYFAKWLSSCD